ncbi:hypothetical protein KAH81_03390 [bacterium]|nr:hypothetical protein [bacterium]
MFKKFTFAIIIFLEVCFAQVSDVTSEPLNTVSSLEPIPTEIAASAISDSIADSLELRERPSEPMAVGLEIGVAGEDVNFVADHVGIGTATPGSYKLNIQGNNGLKIGNSSYEANLVFGNSGSWDSGIRVYDNGDAEMRIWHKNANGQIILATGYDGNQSSTYPTDGIFIDHNKVGIGYASPAASTGKLIVNGNVGIGRTDPSYLLDVNGTSRFSNNMILPGVGTNEIQYGTGDQANYSTYNFAIRGWWGVALKDYSNTVRGVYDFRSGNLTTDGVLSFNGTGNNYIAGNVGIGVTSPTEKLSVNGALVTQNGMVKRDFATFNSTVSSGNPIHIKTNITWSNIMYRILVEGYNYGAAQPINSEIVGYTYAPSPAAPISASAVNHASGASISQYKSDDGYLVVKLSSSNFYYVGFSVSAWLTNPTGTAFDIKALLIVQQAGDLVAHGSQTFSYIGGSQTFTVPSGVTSVSIECWGAQGRSASGGTAGSGGYASGNLTVTAGQTLYIYVGGQGGASGVGGWNGGGSGSSARGSGGGGTDVRYGGTALTNRKIVAGGGGGNYSTYSPGGYGGGTSGGNGGGGANGFGGTQTAGGAGHGGNNGTLGQGGSTGTYTISGGGGGYWGGGAGLAGGGGSGYIGGVTGGSMSNGIRIGNGQVTITW